MPRQDNNKNNTHDFENVPIELLKTLKYTAGFPKHKLRLKKNMILMVMRNKKKKEGLCNETCLILKESMEATLK